MAPGKSLANHTRIGRRAHLRWPAVTLLGLVLALASLGIIYAGDTALRDGQPLTFVDPAGDRLAGVYHPGIRPAGILLLEGFGSDRVTMRSIASEFARAGVHVLAFDFSGHGRSPGGLGFDNASTDRLARQVLAAEDELRRLSGLAPGQILFLGHSMGARVALQAAAMDIEPVGGLVLLGTQVNLATNVQSQVFTGVSDADLAWVQALGPGRPATNVLFLSGRWDDVLPPANARLLLQKLAGPGAVEGQRYGDLARGTGRELHILDRMLHNYEIYSARMLALAKAWASEVWGEEVDLPAGAPTAGRRIGLWLVALVGLFAAVVGGERWAAATLPALPATGGRIHIVDTRRFLWAKLLLWPAALPLSVLLAGLLIFVPLGVPVFNLIYVGFIGGYGLLMLLLYRLGRMPATEGRLPFGGTPASRAGVSMGRTALAVGVSGLLLALTAAYARSGWFYVPPLGDRLWWLLLFTPPTALGFWIGLHEWGMLARAAPDRLAPRLAAGLIGLTPFFLWTAFQATIGSLSGMAGGVQGLIILALVLAYGALAQRLSGRPWLVALLQAILLYWLILPQGALFFV
jgi:pimeloyl-ACP methyl ester carboxylesterase